MAEVDTPTLVLDGHALAEHAGSSETLSPYINGLGVPLGLQPIAWTPYPAAAGVPDRARGYVSAGSHDNPRAVAQAWAEALRLGEFRLEAGGALSAVARHEGLAIEVWFLRSVTDMRA